MTRRPWQGVEVSREISLGHLNSIAESLERLATALEEKRLCEAVDILQSIVTRVRVRREIAEARYKLIKAKHYACEVSSEAVDVARLELELWEELAQFCESPESGKVCT